MESATSTNEENKRVESKKNDQQKLETENFFEKTSPNFEGKKEIPERSSGKTESIKDDDETGKQAGKVLATGDHIFEISRREYEDKVIEEAIRLLNRPLLPEEEEEEAEEEEEVQNEKENEMSRLGAPKTKVPKKSISRPSLSHVNTKIPGEILGQQSPKTSKEDAKNWKVREQELLDKISALEAKAASTEGVKDKFHGQFDQLPPYRQDKPEEDPMEMGKEKDNYKTRFQQIERELFTKDRDHIKEPNLKGMKTPEEIMNHLKAQNEDLRGALAKMTGILRDKTALCVNQEKKIAALNNQVESLKEVVAITKDLLNIRNMEVQHISNDISAMESKIDCERQRHNQMLIKMDEAVKLNAELKKEYENQLKLFQQLRESYEEKIRVMSQNGFIVEENQDQQRMAANGKTNAIVGKSSKGSNFKVNFQDS